MDTSLHAMSPHAVADDLQGIGALLARAAAQHPESSVIYSGGGSLSCTYPILLAEAASLLSGMRAANLAAGRTVLLRLERPEDFIPTFWACCLGGMVPCPLPPQRGDAEAQAAFLDHLSDLFGNPALITTVAQREDLAALAHMPVHDLESLRGHPAAQIWAMPEIDDPAVMMLTSGSTGQPKAVVLTHGNLLASMRAKIEMFQFASDDVTLNWIAFDHVAGLLEGHLLGVTLGSRQVHVEPTFLLQDPLNLLRMIERHRISVTFAPHFLLGQIKERLGALEGTSAKPAFDLSSMKVLISGGEAVVCETARQLLMRLNRFGFGDSVLSPGFGMTETCAGIIFSRAFPEIDKGEEFASLGTAARGLEMRIIGDEGDTLPSGQIGELQLRGSMVTSGYYNNLAATEAAFTQDGWFRTGDAGMLRDGVLRLTGRSKDSIIVNGVNYYSHEIETELGKLDGIESSYVAACPIRPNGSDTEQVAIFFHPSFSLENGLRLHRILVEIRDRLVLLWGFRPSVILPLQKVDMPKTSLGKLQRTALRKRFETGAFAVEQQFVAEITERALGSYTLPESDVECTLVDIYAKMFGLRAEQISTTANFFDLGGTSLDIIMLKTHVKQAFGVDVPTIWLMQYPTIRALAGKLSLSNALTPEPYSPVVAFNTTGMKSPLFCVHPGLGEVLVFANLAKYFVHERPFYALRARGFNKGETLFTSFNEMVETYVAAIRSIQPQGPYYVAGYSYGSAVAFEIAKALELFGEVVAFVGVFNLPPHISDRMHELNFTENMLHLGFFLNFVTQAEAAKLSPRLRNMPKAEQIRFLIDTAPKKRLLELDMDEEKFRTWLSVSESMIAAGINFAPQGKVRSLTVFRADPLAGTRDAWYQRLNAWDDFARQKNRYITVDGEHYTLMGAKHVATFQATLRSELERAEQDAGLRVEVVPEPRSS